MARPQCHHLLESTSFSTTQIHKKSIIVAPRVPRGGTAPVNRGAILDSERGTPDAGAPRASQDS